MVNKDKIVAEVIDIAAQKKMKTWREFTDENEKVEKLEFPIQGLDKHG